MLSKAAPRWPRHVLLGMNLCDFIQKLNSRRKQIDAVKFVYAFDVVEKFPPVSFLKAYLKESKKVAQENEAIAKETAYLRAIIKCIEEYKLESQFSRESIDKRIEQLEKQKVERKRAAIVAAPLPVLKPQQHQQTGSKRLHFAILPDFCLLRIFSNPSNPGLSYLNSSKF
ncbi:hypothetical protein IFM89_021826 [Coptis chinensis]|uniref:FRIGIDA-like protein n=1 Tax=Coptis chinensis TaxID=261450 RepID=A0A835I0C1_9MAGN|nr:hypothetical protein IFM89_021826 [Coptis chinensis]